LQLAKAAPVKKAPAKPAAKKTTAATEAVQEEPVAQPEAEIELAQVRKEAKHLTNITDL